MGSLSRSGKCHPATPQAIPHAAQSRPCLPKPFSGSDPARQSCSARCREDAPSQDPGTVQTTASSCRDTPSVFPRHGYPIPRSDFRSFRYTKGSDPAENTCTKHHFSPASQRRRPFPDTPPAKSQRYSGKMPAPTIFRHQKSRALPLRRRSRFCETGSHRSLCHRSSDRPVP